jgi:MFS transporter, DHA1 family, inner membrane transport protein
MSSTTQPEPDLSRSKLALITLGLGAFAIGTAELVIVGVLNLVAKGLTVSISTAGLLVTTYALGISIGGPIVTAATIRFGRRPLLIAALIAFVAGNVIAVFSVNFGMLILARAITGTIHGLFIGVASSVAAGLVAPEHRGRAMSMVFGGIAVSTVVGVPLGTLAGQLIGWRAAFVGIVIVSIIALIATVIFVPSVGVRGARQFGAQARGAFAPRVLAVLGVGLLVMGGQFAALTYLAPFLERATGISGGSVSIFVLIYGVATAIGVFFGGRAADRSPATTLIVANVVVILALGGLYAARATPAAVGILLLVWGVAGFGLIPALQLRVISLSGAGGELGATLGASAVNAGIALGAIAGGLVVASHGVASTFVLALIICAIVLPATCATWWLRVPGAGPAPGPTGEAPAKPAHQSVS